MLMLLDSEYHNSPIKASLVIKLQLRFISNASSKTAVLLQSFSPPLFQVGCVPPTVHSPYHLIPHTSTASTLLNLAPKLTDPQQTELQDSGTLRYHGCRSYMGGHSTESRTPGCPAQSPWRGPDERCPARDHGQGSR